MFALLALALNPAANAAELPGIALPFDDVDGHWVLSEALPEDYLRAGAEPGWVLTAIDGREFTDAETARRQVAVGPAREVQLHFEIPIEEPEESEEPGEINGATAGEAGEAGEDEAPPELEETILIVPRDPLIYVSQMGILPWPDGFSRGPRVWERDAAAAPLMRDASGRYWTLDAATGAQTPAVTDPTSELDIPDIWWALSGADWVIEREGEVKNGDAAWAQSKLKDTIRLRTFQGVSGDHLVLQTADGLEVLTVDWPRGTLELPTCSPAVPETCLASGRQIQADLLALPGGQEEALEHLGVACMGGVHRGCYEAVALEFPEESARALSCLEGDVADCHEVAEGRLALEPESPGPLAMGLLEFACAMDASGSLGERIRRLEDVGEGCVMLSTAYDSLGQPDRALLSLDQACVLGRADASNEATDRRHKAFASRTVRECEDEKLPIASACVELGMLLQMEEVPTANLDDFDAFLRGCTLGDEQGCVLLGDYVDRWGIENPRVVAAEEQLMASCRQGEQRACLGAAHLLVRHEPRSDAYGLALTTFSSACDEGLASACVGGAEQRRIGDARKVEAPGSVIMWSSACELSSAPGCAGLGAAQAGNKKTWAEAYEAWNRACDIGEAHSCTEIGLLVAEKHPEPWPAEQPADDYLTRGCDNGDPEGCYWLAEDELPRKGDPPEDAYILLERSCEGDYGQGCADLAGVHIDRRTSFDDEIAARHLDSACDNGHFDSCKELGEMFQRGQGVERDRDRARELLERFRFNAPRNHVRVGAHVGFPYLVGGEAELVAPIPYGPAVAIHGSFSYVPVAGTALLLIRGQDNPETDPDLQYYDATVRLYPNNKARGIYGGVGYHQISLVGADFGTDFDRAGFSARLGLHNDNKRTYSNLELGIGQYGVVDINDFDEDEEGTIPLIQSTFGFSFGFSVL